MTTQTSLTDRGGTSARAGVIAVGVDGSDKNHAAVSWAGHEAESSGKRLLLVGATPTYGEPVPRFSADYAFKELENETRQMLDSVRNRLKGTVSDVRIATGAGGASRVLLRAAGRADLIVVGKRGIGAAKRMIVGSTSIGVAGRSPVPVVIVPDAWDQAAHAADPIVVGVTDSTRDAAVLDFAFERAERLGVPLRALYAWQLPSVYSWSPEDIDRWGSGAVEHLEDLLADWIKRYPEVEVVPLAQQGHAAMSLVDEGEKAQLVVVGRHTGPHHVGGFALGSTTRALLHYANFPVGVVPTNQPKQDPLEDLASEEDLPEF